MTRNSQVSVLLGVIVLCSGLAVVFGWMLDIEFLKTFIPGAVTMKLSTAIGFVLGGSQALVLNSKHQERATRWQIVLSYCALSSTAMMAMILVEALSNANMGVSNLFIKETGAVLSESPGEPSIATVIAFMLANSVSMIFIIQQRNAFVWRKAAAGLASLIGVIAVIGYALNAELLYWRIDGISTAMAVHTAILFVLLGLSLWLSKPIIEFESANDRKQKK